MAQVPFETASLSQHTSSPRREGRGQATSLSWWFFGLVCVFLVWFVFVWFFVYLVVFLFFRGFFDFFFLSGFPLDIFSKPSFPKAAVSAGRWKHRQDGSDQ